MSKSSYVDFKAVKREVSMVQVLEHYGLMRQLRQNGDTITGACPIHEGNNKTAFRVSVSKNCWNCFSQCSCGGGVLDFVSKKENVSLLKAAKLLIKWFDLKIEAPGDDDSPSQAKSDSRVRDNKPTKREPAKSAPSNCAESEESEGENKPLAFASLKGLEPSHPYLTGRGLLPETIQTFGLGFCQKGMHAERIVIPIRNLKSELVAYAGCWPEEPTNGIQQYKFPPTFRKWMELFNADRAFKEPALQPLVIVNDFFDVIKLHQSGCRKAVALMDDRMSAAQETLIRQHTAASSHVTLMLGNVVETSIQDEITCRLARHCFVRAYQFDKPEMRPEHLSPEQVRELVGGVL